jgi:GrpB-like predicted nucleotidyltransferase (UPF0157 family)
MCIGLKRNTLELVPFNKNWKNIFDSEKARILRKIRKYIISIEHIGSTSIQNICAKPIIDIAVSLKDYKDGIKCIRGLTELGYLYKGELGIPGRHYFRTNNEIVKFHIHMFAETSILWKNHIFFRNYLNRHPEKAKEYEKLKLKLMEKYKNNRELYTEGKSEFIKSILSS